MVAMAPRVRCKRSQIVQGACVKAGLLDELTQGGSFGRFAGFERAGGKLPRVVLHRRTILSDQDGAAGLIERYDGDVIRLIHEMVDFGHRPTLEVDVPLDDFEPRGLNDEFVENDPWNTHSVPFPSVVPSRRVRSHMKPPGNPETNM